MSSVVISTHVAQRYQDRVDSSVSLTEARLAVLEVASRGKTRSVPRHWMRGDVDPSPGLAFVVWSSKPDLCLLVRAGVAVTIIKRSMCTTGPWRHRQIAAGQNQ